MQHTTIILSKSRTFTGVLAQMGASLKDSKIFIENAVKCNLIDNLTPFQKSTLKKASWSSDWSEVLEFKSPNINFESSTRPKRFFFFRFEE